MFPSPNTALEALQSRLESISMRLDAATDNLMQTRDLFIRHMEQQMLQVQEVRNALHEAASLAKMTPPAEVQPAVTTVKPVGELTLESLLAPLNAAPRAPVAPVVDIETMEELEQQAEGKPSVTARALFESDPEQSWQPPMQPQTGGVAVSPEMVAIQTVTSDLPSTGTLDPDLEKATLDELNEALTRAFAQIASRGAGQ